MAPIPDDYPLNWLPDEYAVIGCIVVVKNSATNDNMGQIFKCTHYVADFMDAELVLHSLKNGEEISLCWDDIIGEANHEVTPYEMQLEIAKYRYGFTIEEEPPYTFFAYAENPAGESSRFGMTDTFSIEQYFLFQTKYQHQIKLVDENDNVLLRAQDGQMVYPTGVTVANIKEYLERDFGAMQNLDNAWQQLKRHGYETNSVSPNAVTFKNSCCEIVAHVEPVEHGERRVRFAATVDRILLGPSTTDMQNYAYTIQASAALTDSLNFFNLTLAPEEWLAFQELCEHDMICSDASEYPAYINGPQL